MQLIANQSTSEIKTLYERYTPLVYNRCRGILHSNDDAWDATQDVFMKLIHALPTIRKKGSIYSWLLSASTNHCISLLRKMREVEFNEETSSTTQDSQDPDQEKQLIIKEVIDRYFRPWDKKTREVVIYAYVYGYKQEEIVKLTGMGESTIRKYLTRFKRATAASGLKYREIVYG